MILISGLIKLMLLLGMGCRSAKFFVKDNGDTVLQNRGILSDRDVRKIQAYIKRHYKEMYMKWAEYSEKGFY